MSFVAHKILHPATGIENCASGFITHSRADCAPPVPPLQPDELDSDLAPRRGLGPIPNLVVTAGNVLEIFIVRVQEEDGRDTKVVSEVKRGGVMDGVSGASLELVCSYRLHGNVESISVLSAGSSDGCRGRDSIIVTFLDAKVSVLHYDDSIYCLRTSSMHCFEGPDWIHLKRGRESFATGPVVKVDPQGRCAGVLVYGVQMIMLKATQVGFGGDDDVFTSGGAVSARIEASYVISLRDLDMKHVKDFVFVHGYIEPVMVVLHEQEPTWAGRVTWKHHTCMVSALSISTSLKQHPLIWSATNLPHDAYKLLAVPSPIGGVLVIGANSIHYHSQSASCSLALNKFGVPVDNSQDIPRSNFTVELDAANTTWLLNDIAMLSTKTGELLLLMLVYDGRIVQRLDLSKSKASVLTSGIATIGNSMFFLGSRLGDSLLVQYTCGMGTSTGLKEEVGDLESDIPSAKRLRISSSDVLPDLVNGDELSIYGSMLNKTESAQKTFSFSVRDSLINVGPLKDFAYGLRTNADLNATGVTKQSNYELVCCSGHGKNGSLCVLQQSIRPELITEVELPVCKGIWTVYHKSGRSQYPDLSKIAAEDEYHAYLIISLESRTMVLETGELLGEVTESVDYFVRGSTVGAGNLFGRRRVIQVYGRGARLLDGSFMTQELLFGPPSSESGSSFDGMIVSSVSIADPFVLLWMTDGSMQLLIGDPSTCTLSVNVPAIFEVRKKLITSCTLYHDKGPEPWLRKASSDAWLSSGISEGIDGNDGVPNDQGDIYCVVCYSNGSMGIYDVPNFNCVFTADNFASGKSHLVDSAIPNPSEDSQEVGSLNEEASGPSKKDTTENIKVVELAMQRWSGQHSRPFVFAILSDGTVLCYHAYLCEGLDNTSKCDDAMPDQNSTNSNNISASRLRNLRFVRIPLDSYTREKVPAQNPCRRMTIFKNVGGYQGLFLSGSKPAWFMICRERVRVHPQLCDGSLSAFAVLHIMNCNHGFIYVTSQGLMKICQLPSVSYDNYWPVQKIPLRGTPHQVTYYAEKNLYSLIVSVPVAKPLNQVLSSLTDQEAGHQAETDSFGSDEFYMIDEFEIRIMEPEKSGAWQTRATIPLQSSENALTVRVVTLHNTTTKENDTLLAVGTGYLQGEDVASRGRILLYSFSKSFDSSGNLVTEVYSKEMKGAVSALASLQGHLLIASGPKIILHKWTGSDLNGIAFADVPPLYVVSMNIVKNFILIGDVHKSIYFLSWKEQGAQLTLLSKDFGSLDCFATEFLIDGSTLSLVVSDDKKNIQIFYYAPKNPDSWKGQKLLSRAEFHVGAHATKFLRLQMFSSSDKTNRFALLYGTLDGSIGCIAPLDEITFRRLQTLQKKLVDVVPHVAGLNPRAFRQFCSNGKAHRPGPDTIIDFELLCHYEMLPLEEQLDIATQISTTRPHILSNLSDLALSTSFL
ncbi:hypothetical protein QQ045_005632 [Rhodiola kirilowii]